MQKNRVSGFTQDLIRIDSQNPPGNERAVAEYVFGILKQAGYNPQIIEFSPRRSNLVCMVKSEKSLKRLLVSPHLDTVPAGEGWSIPPFSGRIKSGRIYGRGASDCKGNLAVSLEVLLRLKEEGSDLYNLDIVFAATADEETGSSLGFKPLLKRLPRLDYGLVLDGSNFQVTYAQKGLLHLRLNIFGKASHGAYPERGDNAVTKAMRSFENIEAWVRAFNRLYRKKAKLTLNIGRIRGGSKVNMVPDECLLDLDFRFMLDIRLKDILRQLRGVIKKEAKRFSLEVLAYQPPVEVSRDNPLADSLRGALRKNKIPCKFIVCKGATVLNFLADSKVPSFVFGFSSSSQAHCRDEYIRVADLNKGADVLKDLLIRLDKCQT